LSNVKRTIIIFIISYIIVGYLKSNIGVAIDWIPEATIWNKLKEYYIRNFSINILFSGLLTIVTTFIIGSSNRNKN
jgi:hypothetical protein